MRLILGLLFILNFVLAGCSSSSTDGSSSSRSFDPGCVTVTSYSGGITLSGDAVYQYRNDTDGNINGTPNPIRQAQVSVLNSSGAIVQCGTTDDSGQFSVSVPVSSGNYTILISARIYDAVTKAAVFNNPTESDVHSISTTVSGASSAAVGTLTATATGELKGGAFNILDKIYAANEYLLTQTNNCTSSFTDCTPFTGARAVFIFWDKGVNPGAYVNSGPLSFYLPGDYELYILGGLSGDTDNSDCDHFDNSIIIHEYGHFIEDIFSDSDSPGGNHNGNTILDPRLAWGEGFANFFQAAVTNIAYYRDTSGNTDGFFSSIFDVDLESGTSDSASIMGEGNFHEFSVTRLLWDAIDPANDDTVAASFAEFWTVFTSSTAGLKNSAHVFRSIGLFHTLQQSLSGHTDWSSLRTAEKHGDDQDDYARDVAALGSCSPTHTSIHGANIPNGNPENGSSSRSNQFSSNDFYKYYHPGGAFAFQLSYSTTSSNAADLDIYILKNGYRFTDSTSTSIAASNKTNVDGQGSVTKSISTSLSAGWYMINIRVDTGVRIGSASTYAMTLNGNSLCPN